MHVANLANSVSPGKNQLAGLVVVGIINEQLPVFALSVHLRVKIAVIKHDGICTSQTRLVVLATDADTVNKFYSLDTNPSRSRRGNETKHPRVSVEPFGNVLTVLYFRRSIQS